MRVDRAALLDFGMALFASGLVGAAGLLVWAETRGRSARASRLAEAPPLPGHIPPLRHQNFSVSPR